jgi:hypothetical protein
MISMPTIGELSISKGNIRALMVSRVIIGVLTIRMLTISSHIDSKTAMRKHMISMLSIRALSIP